VTWVVFSHTEIPIVALMTTFFLGRRLSNVQWVSVILLVDGKKPPLLPHVRSPRRMNDTTGGQQKRRGHIHG